MTKRTIIYLLLIIVIAEVIFGFFYLTRKEEETIPQTPKKLTSQLGPKLSFSPNQGSFPVNQPFEVKILVDTKGKVLTGVDSVIKYNPEETEIIDDPQAGTIFPTYPIIKVKTDKNEIAITGTITDPKQTPFTGIGELATLTVKPLKTGTLSLTFDFSPGKTSDSNFAEKGTSNDVLTQVINANFEITP